jgi:hypothetical protein
MSTEIAKYELPKWWEVNAGPATFEVKADFAFWAVAKLADWISAPHGLDTVRWPKLTDGENELRPIFPDDSHVPLDMKAEVSGADVILREYRVQNTV